MPGRSGYTGHRLFSLDGSRLVAISGDYSFANGVYTFTTAIAVIDTATGTQIGDIIKVSANGDIRLAADDSNVLLTAYQYGSTFADNSVTFVLVALA